MSWEWILLPVAGGFGSYGRYRIEVKLRSSLAKPNTCGFWTRSKPAWPIILINILGSFLAGFLLIVLPAGWWFVLGTGLLGGWTTFSTAMLDIFQIATGQIEHFRASCRKDLLASLVAAIFGLLLCVLAALGGIACASQVLTI